jgi:DNA-binding PadR family transcriptional regulator
MSIPLVLDRLRNTISEFDFNYHRPVREFLRGAVRLHILHHASLGEVHGAWMSAELAHHGYKISPGSLYPTLHKMEAEGLLASHPDVVEGRARRSYMATNKGRRTLENAKKQLRELADEILDGPTPKGSEAPRASGRVRRQL